MATPPGPAIATPPSRKERGVFRAIQKVYASFYNDDAYLERLMHRVDETQVAMGVLVHHSFPDEEELANGVATPTFTFTPYQHQRHRRPRDAAWRGVGHQPRRQLGAGDRERQALQLHDNYTLTLKQYSSRVPLGDYVMDWQADYRGFLDLFTTVGYGFRQFYPAKNSFCLDFEYKKDVNLGPGGQAGARTAPAQHDQFGDGLPD